MNIGREKSYPDNYADDAIKIIEAMSFKGGKIKLVGSMSLRSQQYAGDFDAMEVVETSGSLEKALNGLASNFKEIIRVLRDMPDVFLGDVKCGSVEEWRVLPKRGWDSMKSKSKLDELLKSKVITEAEAKEAHDLLKDTSTIGKLLAQAKIKFHIIRWTPEQIIHGSQTLRDGRTFTLEEGFTSPTITKVDAIGLIQNYRYTDFSMIYEFKHNGKTLNPDVFDVEQSLRDNILLYKHEGNYFKVLKRLFALAKLKGNKKEMERLQPLLNGDLGRLYQILSDVKTLVALLEEGRAGNKNTALPKIRFELDQMKARMATIYNLPAFLKSEHTLLGELASALKSPKASLLLPKLKGIEEHLQKILDNNTPLKGGASLAPPKGTYVDVNVEDATKDPLLNAKDPGDDKKDTATLEKEGRERLAKAKEFETLFRDLAHFYAQRDPAKALGYRVLKDDLYKSAPCLAHDAIYYQPQNGTKVERWEAPERNGLPNGFCNSYEKLDAGHIAAEWLQGLLAQGREANVNGMVKKPYGKMPRDVMDNYLTPLMKQVRADPKIPDKIKKLSQSLLTQWLGSWTANNTHAENADFAPTYGGLDQELGKPAK